MARKTAQTESSTGKLDSAMKRGDIIAWPETRSYTRSDMTTYQSTVYYIGIVTSVRKGGAELRVNAGLGAVVTVIPTADSAGVRGSRIDQEKAKAWLKTAYPARDGVRLESMDMVREVVRQWLID